MSPVSNGTSVPIQALQNALVQAGFTEVELERNPEIVEWVARKYGIRDPSDVQSIADLRFPTPEMKDQLIREVKSWPTEVRQPSTTASVGGALAEPTRAGESRQTSTNTPELLQRAVRQRVHALLSEFLEADPDAIHPDANLKEHLGATYRNKVKLVQALEQEIAFAIHDLGNRTQRTFNGVTIYDVDPKEKWVHQIPDESWQRWNTVKDVTDYVERRMGLDVPGMVRSIIGTAFRAGSEEVRLTTKLSDLGGSFVDKTQMVMQLESQFSFKLPGYRVVHHDQRGVRTPRVIPEEKWINRIPDEHWQKWQSVKDVSEYIERRMALRTSVEVKKIVAEALHRPVVEMGADIIADYDASYTDRIALVTNLEQEFNIRIPEEDWQELRTAEEFADYIQGRFWPELRRLET